MSHYGGDGRGLRRQRPDHAGRLADVHVHALIAGICGMNMLPDLFMNQWFFAVVMVMMVVVSCSLLTILYRRGSL